MRNHYLLAEPLRRRPFEHGVDEPSLQHDLARADIGDDVAMALQLAPAHPWDRWQTMRITDLDVQRGLPVKIAGIGRVLARRRAS